VEGRGCREETEAREEKRGVNVHKNFGSHVIFLLAVAIDSCKFLPV
jgi:hypothetical protein